MSERRRGSKPARQYQSQRSADSAVSHFLYTFRSSPALLSGSRSQRNLSAMTSCSSDVDFDRRAGTVSFSIEDFPGEASARTEPASTKTDAKGDGGTTEACAGSKEDADRSGRSGEVSFSVEDFPSEAPSGQDLGRAKPALLRTRNAGDENLTEVCVLSKENVGMESVVASAPPSKDGLVPTSFGESADVLVDRNAGCTVVKVASATEVETSTAGVMKSKRIQVAPVIPVSFLKSGIVRRSQSDTHLSHMDAVLPPYPAQCRSCSSQPATEGVKVLTVSGSREIGMPPCSCFGVKRRSQDCLVRYSPQSEACSVETRKADFQAALHKNVVHVKCSCSPKLSSRQDGSPCRACRGNEKNETTLNSFENSAATDRAKADSSSEDHAMEQLRNYLTQYLDPHVLEQVVKTVHSQCSGPGEVLHGDPSARTDEQPSTQGATKRPDQTPPQTEDSSSSPHDQQHSDSTNKDFIGVCRLLAQLVSQGHPPTEEHTSNQRTDDSKSSHHSYRHQSSVDHSTATACSSVQLRCDDCTGNTCSRRETTPGLPLRGEDVTLDGVRPLMTSLAAVECESEGSGGPLPEDRPTPADRNREPEGELHFPAAPTETELATNENNGPLDDSSSSDSSSNSSSSSHSSGSVVASHDMTSSEGFEDIRLQIEEGVRYAHVLVSTGDFRSMPAPIARNLLASGSLPEVTFCTLDVTSLPAYSETDPYVRAAPPSYSAVMAENKRLQRQKSKKFTIIGLLIAGAVVIGVILIISFRADSPSTVPSSSPVI